MPVPAGPVRRGTAAAEQFALDVTGLPDGALKIAKFETEALRLNAHYAVYVDAVSTQDRLGLDELIEAEATLKLQWEGGIRTIHGTVAGAEYSGDTPDGPSYRLELRSPLHPLALRRNNRVFLGKSVTAIARQVLEGAGLAAERLRLEVQEEPAPRELVVQYDETDLAFLERQLAYHGLVYAFEQGADRAQLVISDNSSRLPELLETATLDYEVSSGQTRNATTVYEWLPNLRRTVRGVRLRDYNPQAPQRRLEAQAGETPDEYRYAEHYGERSEGKRLARIRQEAHAWQRRTVRARTDCRAVMPGGAIELEGHPAPENNGQWLIVAADLVGDQRSGFAYAPEDAEVTFEAQVTLIPANVAFRPPAPAPTGRAPGMFSARVEGDGGEYAYLDDAGCYRIRLPFDRSDRSDAEASPPVRLAQPYGGSGYGMHFPLHHGTEVLVGFANGDLDRPVMLGSLYNGDNPSPVNSANPTQNRLRTWAGNELLMEDRAGAERVELSTPEGKNRLSLDAAEEGHKVEIDSSDGDVAMRAGANLTSEAGRNQHTEVGGKQTVTVQKDQRLLTKEGDLAYQAGKDCSIKARENIHLQASRANLTARAGKDLRMQAGQGMAVEVRKSDAEVKATKGNVTLQAAKAITLRGEGNGPIRIGQSGATIEIKANGNLSIDASQVEISGGSIAIKGGAVGNN